MVVIKPKRSLVVGSQVSLNALPSANGHEAAGHVLFISLLFFPSFGRLPLQRLFFWIINFLFLENVFEFLEKEFLEYSVVVELESRDESHESGVVPIEYLAQMGIQIDHSPFGIGELVETASDMRKRCEAKRY